MKVDDKSVIVVQALDGTISINGVVYKCLASVKGVPEGMVDIQWRPDLKWEQPGWVSTSNGAKAFGDFKTMNPYVVAWLGAHAAAEVKAAELAAEHEAARTSAELHEAAERRKIETMAAEIAPLQFEAQSIEQEIFDAMTRDLIARGLLDPALLSRRNELRQKLREMVERSTDNGG